MYQLKFDESLCEACETYDCLMRCQYMDFELEKAKEKIGELAKDDFDLLIYTLYPSTGEQYLKWKYGLEEKPDTVKPKTLDDIRAEDEAMAAAIEQVKSLLDDLDIKDYIKPYSRCLCCNQRLETGGLSNRPL